MLVSIFYFEAFKFCFLVHHLLYEQLNLKASHYR
ncbi:hypothetical protein VP249E411_P0147 [Vibrio phage 249E41-1]|nr:hypothetical protein VP249E411_P0147 [Vibrio phage 249E41-1]